MNTETDKKPLIDALVPIGIVHENDWNPNQMEERTYRATRESIRHYGFIDPVTVRPHPSIEGEYEIIDGEHRVRAAAEEGHIEVPVIVLDLPDAQAKRLTVILNETRGEADVPALGKLLAEIEAELQGDPEVWLGLPYTKDELEQFTSLADVNWDDYLRPESGKADISFTASQHVLKLEFTSERKLEQVTRFLAMLAKEWEIEDRAEVVLRVAKEAAATL